jgi:hypothetical protein
VRKQLLNRRDLQSNQPWYAIWNSDKNISKEQKKYRKIVRYIDCIIERNSIQQKWFAEGCMQRKGQGIQGSDNV